MLIVAQSNEVCQTDGSPDPVTYTHTSVCFSITPPKSQIAMLPQTREPEHVNCAIRNEENCQPRVREQFITLPSKQLSPARRTGRLSEDQSLRNRADTPFCMKCTFSPSKRMDTYTEECLEITCRMLLWLLGLPRSACKGN